MLLPNFMRFRRKRVGEQTHMDNFSLKKNPKRIYLAFVPFNVLVEVLKNEEKPKIIKREKFHPSSISCWVI